MSDYKIHVLVCGGTGCRASESDQVFDNLTSEIKNQGLDKFAKVVKTGCFGSVSYTHLTLPTIYSV